MLEQWHNHQLRVHMFLQHDHLHMFLQCDRTIKQPTNSLSPSSLLRRELDCSAGISRLGGTFLFFMFTWETLPGRDEI